MVDERNTNIDINSSPSWKNCLDESMSKWLNKYTCPGFMFVPRKPWPFRNEWHDIGCADTNVIWQLEIREGKDQPQELPKQHDNKGKTVGTLLHLTKPIHGSGKLVVLDSGFCVLQGLVELKKLGVFAHAVTNKRRYWSKHVKGDDIIQHFANKEVGSADALRGQLDGVPVYIYGMKEPDYTMMLMATYGTSAEQGDEKARNFMDGGSKVVKKFKYLEVVYNHYQFWGCDRQQQLHADVTDINGRDMDDFTMGQQSFLFSPSSDGGEYPECGLLFPQSDESGCPKSTQIDC